MTAWGPGEAARVTRLARAGAAPSPDLVGEVLGPRAELLGEDGWAAARAELAARLLGAGPLQPLLDLPGVTDVLVNGVAGV